MTKQEALAKIEELKRYVEGEEQKQGLHVETFTLSGGKTGVMVQFPDSFEKPEMPVLEYMIREAARKGYKIYGMESRIEMWNKLRFPYIATSENSLSRHWKGDTASTYGRLPDHPAVRSFTGQRLWFIVDTAQDATEHFGKSFNQLMEEKVNVIHPIAWLALFMATANPKDTHTYLSREGWEWVGAITESYAAGGFSLSAGLVLGWLGPGYSDGDLRARSAVS